MSLAESQDPSNMKCQQVLTEHPYTNMLGKKLSEVSKQLL